MELDQVKTTQQNKLIEKFNINLYGKIINIEVIYDKEYEKEFKNKIKGLFSINK